MPRIKYKHKYHTVSSGTALHALSGGLERLSSGLERGSPFSSSGLERGPPLSSRSRPHVASLFTTNTTVTNSAGRLVLEIIRYCL